MARGGSSGVSWRMVGMTLVSVGALAAVVFDFLTDDLWWGRGYEPPPEINNDPDVAALRASVHDRQKSAHDMEMELEKMRTQAKDLMRRNEDLQRRAEAAAAETAQVGGAADVPVSSTGWFGSWAAIKPPAKGASKPKKFGEWELQDGRNKFADWVSKAATYEELYTFAALRGTAGTPDEGVDLEAALPWSDCAVEGDECDCKSGKVRYGAEGKWITLEGKKTILCSTGKFGGKDPIRGVQKTCQCARLEKKRNDAKMAPRDGSPVKYDQLCKSGAAAYELLWSCDRARSRLPAPLHPHNDAQYVLDKSVTEMCASQELRGQLETYLDCNFASSYKRWTNEESEWIDEAYLSYIGGEPGSSYEWAMTNLIRSVHVFSTRPIIVVAMGSSFTPPDNWAEFPNLIVFKMHSLITGLGFNYNKFRAIVGSRIIAGVELDSDQLLASSRMDSLFDATIKACTADYPFPIAPIHWMSREDGANASSNDKAYPSPYVGTRTMRWVHAHPTWTYWTIPFFHDALLIRMTVQLKPGSTAMVWDLSASSPRSVVGVLEQGKSGQVARNFEYEEWMRSDEPTLNARLWQMNATKSWCKMDLEPDIFMRRRGLDRDLYWDANWYPDGLPLMFYSVHNSKNFRWTDMLLTYISQCASMDPSTRGRCSDMGDEGKASAICRLESGESMAARLSNPSAFARSICCCLEPRLESPIFYRGHWYSDARELPQLSRGRAMGDARCLAV